MHSPRRPTLGLTQGGPLAHTLLAISQNSIVQYSNDQPAMSARGSKPERPPIALMSAFATSCGHAAELALVRVVPTH